MTLLFQYVIGRVYFTIELKSLWDQIDSNAAGKTGSGICCSFPPRMAVVWIRNDVFAWAKTRSSKICKDVYFWTYLQCTSLTNRTTYGESTPPDASVGAQCSTFRTECAIRHGCRWFQTETRWYVFKAIRWIEWVQLVKCEERKQQNYLR